EKEVVRLKEEAARNPPPADITAKLATARAVRFQARQAATNALELFETSTKKANAAKDKLAQARSENPAETLANTKAAVARLKAAQVQATVYRLRESLAAKKREQEKLLAAAAER